LAADRSEAELGARHPAFERLDAFDVAGLFEAAGVHAEVAVGGADQVLELVEGERLGHRERAHDGQPDPLVDEAVERERGPRGGAPFTAASGAGPAEGWAREARAVARLPTVPPRDQE